MNHLNWKNLIPASKLDAVNRAFEHAFGTTEIDDIAPLTGGRSSALVYKVTVHRKSYVLRLVTQVEPLTDPVRHFICLNAAAQAGLAPPLRYTNAQDAISIVDFIEHTTLASGFASEKALFSQLATRIRAIHALPLFPPLIGFLDGVDGLVERHKSSGVLPDAINEEHFRYYASVQRAYPRQDPDLVSSHNDLNPTNVLHNGGTIWIVDWEAAFANDRYVDLAIVNIFFGSGERGEETLLTTYFGDCLNDYHRARFFLMQQVCFMYISMLFLHLASSSSPPNSGENSPREVLCLKEFHSQLRSGQISLASTDQYLLYAKALLKESLSQMQTTRFQQAIELLESKPN